jgi:ribosomal protein S18 acetylase RimI-like enzyme
MTDRVVIRPARHSDAEFVGACAPLLLEYGSPAWEDPPALAPGFSEVLAGAVGSKEPRAQVLIAEDADGARLGFISLKIGQDVVGSQRAHVADLAVAESARRMGVGRALMTAAEEWARREGLTMLSLDVWSTNERALSFYRSIGYVPESLCLIKRLD